MVSETAGGLSGARYSWVGASSPGPRRNLGRGPGVAASGVVVADTSDPQS